METLLVCFVIYGPEPASTPVTFKSTSAGKAVALLSKETLLVAARAEIVIFFDKRINVRSSTMVFNCYICVCNNKTTPVSSLGALKFVILDNVIGEPAVAEFGAPVAFWEASALKSITLAPDVIVPVELNLVKWSSAKLPVTIEPPTEVRATALTTVVAEAVTFKSPVNVVPAISIVAALAAWTVTVAAAEKSISVA